MYADSYGFNEGFTNKTNSGDYMRAEIYPQIFKKHAVSDSLFYTSYSFYETHPEQLKILMDSLTSVFTKLQSAAVLLEGDESKEEPVVQKQNEIRDNPNNPFNEEQQKIWNERKKNIREKVEKEKLENSNLSSSFSRGINNNQILRIIFPRLCACMLQAGG